MNSYDLLIDALQLLRMSPNADAPHFAKAIENIEEVIRHLADPDLIFGPLSPIGNQAQTRDEILIRALAGVSAEARRWYNQHRYPQLERASHVTIGISYQLFSVLGMVPTGKEKDWVEAIMSLWQESGEDWEIITKGIADASEARLSGRLTFGGPRSVTKFIGNARSLALAAKRGPVNKPIIIEG